MATPDEIKQVFALTQTCEDIAGAIFELAKKQRDAGTLTTVEFNQAYQDYLSIMQRAREIYYAVSHQTAMQTAASDDLSTIANATTKLADGLKNLQTVEKAISISLRVMTAIGTLAAAIMDPTHVSAGAAVGSIAQVLGAATRSSG